MPKENFPKRFRGEEIALLTHIPTAAQVAECRAALAAVLPAWHHFRGCEAIEDERTRGEITAQAAEELLTAVKAHAPLFDTLVKAEIEAATDERQLARLRLMSGSENAAQRAPVTEIGERVAEALEYAMAERGLVIIEGVARIGKTFSVEAWCDAHRGEARYVQTPSSNDDSSFLRAICEALGLADGLAIKTVELRAAIAATLRSGDLMMVFDEGHFLWPTRNLRKAMPHRILWIMTQLVNMGVSVAIVTTPQFTKNQQVLEKHSGWSSEQFIGRIERYVALPDKLEDDDLAAVAGYWMPSGDERAIGTLVDYAKSSQKYLQGIASLAKRARYLAKKQGRKEPVYGDVIAALNEGVIPSDNALATALSQGRPTGGRKAARATSAEPAQERCRPLSKPPQTRQTTAPAPTVARSEPSQDFAFSPPERDTGSAVLSP
jgi:hypothetical protein